MVSPRSGRDNLPTTHPAVRHDLMHPAMPAAAVSKLRQRLRHTLGSDVVRYYACFFIPSSSRSIMIISLGCLSYVSRVRMLPPLDVRTYAALQRASAAVLDPFPVGMHIQILDALMDGVPVVCL